MRTRDVGNGPVETDSSQAARFARALASLTRSELVAPIHTVGGFIDLLTEDATRSGFSAYDADLARIRSAWTRLAGMVDAFVASDVSTLSSDDDVEEPTAKLRHQLRTPIAAILGYAELLAEDATEAGRTAFADVLQALVTATRRMLEQVDALVAALRTQDGADLAGGGALRGHAARAAIHAVLSSPMDPPPSPAGRILIVDDDATNLDLLTRRLERDGHGVKTASSGTEALALLDVDATDLILLDLIMPGLTGIDVLRLLREREDTKLLPIIIISGLSEEDGAIRCIEAGADDYLTKPVDAVLLRARINAALERKLLRDREIAVTRRLKVEQERSETLLRNVLPESIVARMRDGESVIADHFDAATILFCDIVGFTALSARLSPGATLDILNAIFSAFDRLAADEGVEKIKTIGDAYMVAGGLPKPRSDHAAAVAAMAMKLPAVARTIGTRLGLPLAVRVGIDTGPVVAGIIGTDKFVYDVWGDTVNTASRMEHHGVAGRVHITAATRAALGPVYAYEPRPPIEIKGKGTMETFLIAAA